MFAQDETSDETESIDEGNEQVPPRLSFLDLPDEVRSKIYKLAVYDHDRGAVFLPRAVPRKLDMDTDLDVTYAFVQESRDSEPTEYLAWPINEGHSLAAGVLQEVDQQFADVTEPQPQIVTPISGYVYSDDDGENGPAHALDPLLRRLGITPQVWHDVHALRVAAEEDANDDSQEDQTGKGCGHEGCACNCAHDPSEDSILRHDPQTLKLLPLEACLTNTCDDNRCEHCAGHGLDFLE